MVVSHRFTCNCCVIFEVHTPYCVQDRIAGGIPKVLSSCGARSFGNQPEESGADSSSRTCQSGSCPCLHGRYTTSAGF